MNAEPTPEPPKDSPSGLPAQLASRVEAIVRAAEEEAATVQRDLEAQRRVAEDEVRQYLTDARRRADALGEQRVRRLRELTDELVERAELVKRQLEALAGAIERATGAVERDADLVGDAEPGGTLPGGPIAPRPTETAQPEEPVFRPPPAPPAAPPAPPGRPGAELAPPPGGYPAPAETRSDDLGAARLVAIEMAVAGRSRDEVDLHLRAQFQVQDTTQLLDDVFGPPAQTDSRTSH